MVIILLAIFVGIYGITALLPAPNLDAALTEFGFVPNRFSSLDWGMLDWSLASAAKFWPFITYVFLHGDLMHVTLNSLWFLAFGTPVARRLGTLWFLAFCACTAVAGALLYWLLNAGSDVPMVGASGAISGLMGGAVRFMFLDPRGDFGRDGGILPLQSSQVITFAGVWTMVNLVFGIGGIGLSGEGQSIAWEAHLGGFFAGLLLFSAFDWRKPIRTPGMVVYEEIP